jgi:hypothetical protein
MRSVTVSAVYDEDDPARGACGVSQVAWRTDARRIAARRGLILAAKMEIWRPNPTEFTREGFLVGIAASIAIPALSLFVSHAKAWLPESLFFLWKAARPRDLGRGPSVLWQWAR